MEFKTIYKPVKKPIGVEITLGDVLYDVMDHWNFEFSDGTDYEYDADNDTIVVTVGGKKVDPKKVKIQLTEVQE